MRLLYNSYKSNCIRFILAKEEPLFIFPQESLRLHLGFWLSSDARRHYGATKRKVPLLRLVGGIISKWKEESTA